MLTARRIVNEVRFILEKLLEISCLSAIGFSRAQNSAVLQALGDVQCLQVRPLLLHGTCQSPTWGTPYISIYVSIVCSQSNANAKKWHCPLVTKTAHRWWKFYTVRLKSTPELNSPAVGR